MGEASANCFTVSYAPLSADACGKGTTRCRDRDPADGDACRLISREAARHARHRETEHMISHIVLPHRVPARTERKSSAKVVDRRRLETGADPCIPLVAFIEELPAYRLTINRVTSYDLCIPQYLSTTLPDIVSSKSCF